MEGQISKLPTEDEDPSRREVHLPYVIFIDEEKNIVWTSTDPMQAKAHSTHERFRMTPGRKNYKFYDGSRNEYLEKTTSLG